jgi:[acyl-carrier-protein] S-malonyltransferase
VKRWAFLFPGQGAQYVGMGKDFADSFSIARETFEEADDLLSFNLSKVIFEGPEELLTQTKHSQPAIFVTSLAVLRTLQKELPDLKPFAAAGLSLGEYSALCASGKMAFDEALKLVQKRARFMNEACEKVPGTMAAVLGMSGEEVEGALKGIDGVWLANYNCPGQIVISGTQQGVEKGSERLKEAGAKRILPLMVSGAFHSGLMQMAREALEPFVSMAKIRETPIRLLMNVPGDFVEKESEIRNHLIAQVTESVRWEQGILACEKEGIDFYLEIGCGKTLSGMNRKIGVKGATLSVEKIPDLEIVAKRLSCQC